MEEINGRRIGGSQPWGEEAGEDKQGQESQADGRFAVNNVAAGAEYYTVTASQRFPGGGFDTLAAKLAVSAGQVIDLGDIKLKRQK